jgi:histidinol-phosphate aminotransferase
VASLGNRAELDRRVRSNAASRHHLLGALAERDLAHTESQANFVYFELGFPGEESFARFSERGVIIRPMSGGWLRVTIGNQSENRRFVEALDEVLALVLRLNP